jgi:lysophospholipase L1-like esterase
MSVLGPLRTTVIPSNAYLDGVTRVPGVTPPSTPPNAYDTSGLQVGGNLNFFSSVELTGTGPFIGKAVPWTDQGIPISVGVIVDNVYSQTIDLTGQPVGVKFPFTVTLDGLPHVVRFEEQASLTDLSGGNYTLYVPPASRLVLSGDSIVAGQAASVRSLGYSSTVRRLLSPSGYRTAIHGTPGIGMFGSQNRYLQDGPRCDGVSRNIVGVALQINDANNGVSLANYDASMTTYLNGLFGLVPTAKVLLISSPQSATLGAVLPGYRAVMAAHAAADPTRVFYLDNSALFPGASPWATYIQADGIHPLDPGMALLATAVANAVAAIP